MGGRFLVTGSDGFIGRHVVRGLVAAGADVHVTTRRSTPSRAGVESTRIDLTESEAVARYIHRVQPDVLIHLASSVQGARDRNLVLPMLKDNLQTSVNVMAGAADIPGCRVLLAGSVEEPRTLDTHHGAHSPYAAAKVASTAYATLFREVWALPVTVLRLAMVYGPDQPDRTKLIPYSVTELLQRRPPQLTSSTRLIDWVHVGDVVDAFLRAAERPAGAVVDIGSGTPTSIRDTMAEVTDLVREITGVDAGVAFGALPDRPADRSHIADPGPAAELLGWRPKTSLRDGLRDTILWYRDRAVGDLLTL